MVDERGTLIRFDNAKESDRILNGFSDWQGATEGVEGGTLEGVSDEGVLRSNLDRSQIEPYLRSVKAKNWRFVDSGEPTAFGEEEPVYPGGERVADEDAEAGVDRNFETETRKTLFGEDGHPFTSPNVRRARRLRDADNGESLNDSE
jgi:hypothetical protein